PFFLSLYCLSYSMNSKKARYFYLTFSAASYKKVCFFILFKENNKILNVYKVRKQVFVYAKKTKNFKIKITDSKKFAVLLNDEQD
ncbi:hypothetical protein, partial [Carnobacterium sp. ISL-102]|uniref:hypothetical protein n=1 Tax=Carnobacterium sp. ISL-102 TaxID=2819142 RepID=UPI001BEBE0B2